MKNILVPSLAVFLLTTLGTSVESTVKKVVRDSGL
jgi:hypothetical protein